MNVFNVVLGGVTIEIGLTFWWALAAISAGTIIGALLIALHATQGPRLGVPQSIQSRGQFGFYGAAFMFPAVLALNIGFIAAQLVIQAQALSGVTSALTIPQWILILAVPALVIGIYGYRWIHGAIQVTAVVVTIALVIMAIQALRHGSLPASQASTAAPSPGLFLAGVALLTIDMLSFGPFVSDYSRYLPARINGRQLFWAIYAGNVTATIFSCAVGAYITALLPKLDPVSAVGQVCGYVGADRDGRQLDRRRVLQRLHRRDAGPVDRQHVAAVQAGVGRRPGDPVHRRHGRRGGHRPASATSRSSPT